MMGVHSSWDKSFSNTSDVVDDISQRKPRRPRQAMTARESNAFNEMFAMIFDAAMAQENSLLSNDSAIGVGMDGIDDLIGKLRKYPKRLKWSTELDDMLDRQKEVINLFTTDQELLEWATDAVFGESQRYEAAAHKAISEAATSGVKGELPMLQPPTYPYLVALIMQTFRDKFNDPHLALSMFEHARNLSIASYVFGCSSQAYHQLIETRWKCFQDLTGVLEALQEMQLNGVKVSGQTRRLVEKLRREIGEKHLWTEESEFGSNEVLNILAQIERLALSSREGVLPVSGKANTLSPDAKWDEWKSLDIGDDDGDEWGFDQWSSRPRKEPARERIFDEVKRPAGPLRPRRQNFEENTNFVNEPFASASSSQPTDSFRGAKRDFNEDEFMDLDFTRSLRRKSFDTEKKASEPSNFVDDLSFDDGEYFSGVSSSKTDNHTKKDEWGFNQGKSQMGDADEQGWEGTGKESIKRARSRSSELKDDRDFEDADSRADWLNSNVQGSQDGDALDQHPSNEPKRGRILNMLDQQVMTILISNQRLTGRW
ncbi:hypothetical protein C0993_006709 [Termitomyces sp. T159_Od127]|nr:hypothetical protein C0993_006709 [Termitomyces sp. T159_Od127]